MPKTIRVLVVDDNEDHARLAAEFLQMSGPFEVKTAQDTQAMWELLAAETSDVVLLDHNLPDGTGLEALAQFAARGHQMPVVMVTGRGDERVAAQAIQQGAMDYIVKSGDYLRMLPALVEKAVRTHQLILSAQRSMEQIRYHALLLDNVLDAVVVWNLEGRITFWNRAAERLFGGNAQERLSQPAAEFYWPAFNPTIEAPPPDTDLVDVERRFQPQPGKEIWVSSNLTALHDSSGKLLGYMDVARDITARKQLEAQIQTAQTQLTQAARMAAIGELASGVAHQISNPLTTVIAEAQILLRTPAADPLVRESAEAIEQAGWRAQGAVQRLLDFSRPASTMQETLAINETIQHALTLVGGQIESAGVTLQLELAPNLPPFHGNARQIEDLWVNLLLMARDATANGQPHRIVVRTRPVKVLAPPTVKVGEYRSTETWHSPGTEVEVNDDGEVIPPEQLASIFEPVFTGPAAGRGTGLELSICREIVRQHRGQIRAASASGQGTTFTVILPASAASLPAVTSGAPSSHTPVKLEA
jgi:two-component system cell cycle sensor histidine kinase/response regulator CckA